MSQRSTFIPPVRRINDEDEPADPPITPPDYEPPTPPNFSDDEEVSDDEHPDHEKVSQVKANLAETETRRAFWMETHL